jgi:hypothetical protein
MFGALARLAVSRDPEELCRLVGEALKSDSIVGAGMLAAVEKNSSEVRERFIVLAELSEDEADRVRALPFLWLPGGERAVGIVMSEGQHIGEWGLHDISQLRAGIVRGAAADGYERAVRRPRLRVVK